MAEGRGFLVAVTEGVAVSSSERFVLRVQDEMQSRLSGLQARVPEAVDLVRFALGGRFLRTRLGAALREAASETPEGDAVAVCVATEIVHAATLCHDDLIDRSPFRRGRPALWASSGTAGAVLAGDLLLTEGMAALQALDAPRPRAASGLLSALREMGTAEMNLACATPPLTPYDPRWLANNARKTAALFGFVAAECVGASGELFTALETSGQRIGAAYQSIDDLADAAEEGPGATLAALDPSACAATLVADLRQALQALAPWPTIQAALARYLRMEILPMCPPVVSAEAFATA